MAITHSTVVVVADDGTSPVGTDEWNAAHVGDHNALTIGADGQHSLATQVLSGVAASTTQIGHAKVGADTPSTQAFGDAAVVGTGDGGANSLHKHAFPADPVTAHAAAGDPHGGYRLESADHSHATTGLQAGQVAHSALSGIAATDHHSNANDHTQSHTHASAGDGTTLTPATLNVPATATPAQTADGQAVWDSDDNLLTVGDGAGRQTFLPVNDATSDPLAVGTAADGTQATVARKDHVHATGAGTPSTQAFSDAAAVGTGPAASMTDHKHAWPALGTTAAAVGTSAGGAATTPSKSDHVHATGAGTPSTQAFADAAAVGTGPAAAMTDHKHAMPADPVTAHVAAADPHTGYVLESLLNAKGDLITASADNTPALLTVGANDTILMADSAQASGLKWAAVATTAELADVATVEVAGTSDTFTRGDHVHAHGSGYLPDAHHAQSHGDGDHTGVNKVGARQDGTDKTTTGQKWLNFLSALGLNTIAEDSGNSEMEVRVRTLLPSGMFFRNNIVAALALTAMTRPGTAVTTGYTVPGAGSVIGMTGNCLAGDAVTAGTITFHVYKNGASVFSQAVTTGSSFVATQAVGTDTFVSGDLIQIYVTTDAGFLPTASADWEVTPLLALD